MSDKNNPTISDIRFTFIWRTKNKTKALTVPIKSRIVELLLRDCQEIGYENLGGVVGSSYVKISVLANTNHSPQYVAQKFKGGTSNILRNEFPELLETVDNKSLWESGYLCVTDEEKCKDMIGRYLE